MQNLVDKIRAIRNVTVSVDISNRDYHATHHDSSSTLKRFAKSPLEYWHYRIAKDREPPKIGYSANLGSAVHAAVLEPESFGSVVQVFDGKGGPNSKAFRSFAEGLAPDQVAICEEDLDRVEMMANSLFDHEEAGHLLQEHGHSELSLFWTEPVSGLPLKCRFDRLIDQGSIGATILDIKCLSDSSPQGFRRAVRQFRYDLSAALYCQGRNLALNLPEDWHGGFYFLAVGNQWPHETGVYRLGPRTMEAAAVQVRQVIDDIARLRAKVPASQPWPSHTAHGVIEIEVLGYSVGEQLEPEEEVA